ncbi:hypothetical protein M3J09_002858 [Ascochyta lentis]
MLKLSEAFPSRADSLKTTNESRQRTMRQVSITDSPGPCMIVAVCQKPRGLWCWLPGLSPCQNMALSFADRQSMRVVRNCLF